MNETSTAVASFQGAEPEEGRALAIATTRSAQEVQAAMVIAQQFPRNQRQAMSRILEACSRTSLAEQARYAYERGGDVISGPSIRLAEVLARNWGNLDAGIIELSTDAITGITECMAYAWDLQTNTRFTKVFSVRHERKARGRIRKIDDPRDVYEHVANMGSRRMRSCILAIIPGDVVEAAMEQCHQTLLGQTEGPLCDRIGVMVRRFETQLRVTEEMIAERLGHTVDLVTEEEFAELWQIYTSIKEGNTKRDRWFAIPGTTKEGDDSDKTKSQRMAEAMTPSGLAAGDVVDAELPEDIEPSGDAQYDHESAADEHADTDQGAGPKGDKLFDKGHPEAT